MSFKLPVTVILLILFQTTLFLKPDVILIDKIAAVVNEEIITQSDIDNAIRLYTILRKKDVSTQDFYISVLQDLIKYKVVYLEYKDEFILQQEDYTGVQTSIVQKLGSYNKLIGLLRQYDMKWEDFKDFIKEKVLYENVLKNIFQIKITIDFEEIETFYNEQYLPSQKSLQLKPKTLIEMAPLIETQLRKDRTDEALAGWLKEITASYKIENKLLQD